MKQRKRGHPILGVTILCTVCAALCAGVLTWLLMARFEAGLLEVCAGQQDGYVQLMLDQIGLQGGQTSAGTIEAILSTMDASSNKYWTFSRGQDMLFVKDVLETNKYKGFTTATYYGSESAQTFLDSIRLERVSHANITIEEKHYIASGAAFEYQGDTYRLCLLTNRDVLLDNNLFLGAKTELCAMIIGILALFVIVSAVLAQRIRRLQYQGDRQDEAIETLNQSLDKMSRLFSERDLHDTRTNLWTQEALPVFVGKLRARNVYPIALAKVRCANGETVQALINRACVTLDRSVLRFKLEEHLIGFLFVQCDPRLANESIQSLLNEDISLQEFQMLSGEGEGPGERLASAVTKEGETKWPSGYIGSTV